MLFIFTQALAFFRLRLLHTIHEDQTFALRCIGRLGRKLDPCGLSKRPARAAQGAAVRGAYDVGDRDQAAWDGFKLSQ